MTEMSQAPHVDVVVVGAGLAGLTAARELTAAGLTVQVLEARNRVGGRTVNHALGENSVVETGGQFVGPTQDHVLRLAASVGVGTFPAYDTGSSMYVKNGNARRFDGGVPPDLAALPDVGVLVARIDRAANQIPVDRPWSAPRAREWDTQTLATWARRHSATAGGVELLDILLGSVFGGTSADASALFGLAYVAGAGNEYTPGTVDRLMSVAGGAQQWRFLGGSQAICIEIAKQLGDAVRLDTPVRRVEQYPDRVVVCSDTESWIARSAVVAIPPVLVTRIDWSPALPAPQEALFQRMNFGGLAKCEAVYPEPFWRASGLSGQALFRDSDVPVSSMFDNSPPDGSQGVLMGFVGTWGARHRGGRNWSDGTDAERRGEVLRAFASAVGPRALEPTEWIELDWTREHWTRGGPTAVLAPGVLTELGRWRDTAFGRVQWAGAEHSDYWNGYMDGAVRSGENAAAAILSTEGELSWNNAS
ncbi:monoamine oxidase [Rhodococcus sp. 15-725-2-2b]|uniref:flavin monoamine oxidase family protein n=1 Tax=unclassified Rhodococcus (in: high G+C Gram-positive bacteria) TaxID=192944 RepID=UPI000B9B0D8E|nr:MULTISPECIES: FAD-dependent oxidoreductase [unclassified Rhodococcus (in: high G+C Gram-positive bacteria)]OZC61749.1 monoamine oxidase [Rhodococcus sp. 06-469-3-2]OZD42938.1 monoamine oxidase [Rhodococcus sp. 06-1477-1A]OZE74014.1 monoamine oxidase [Rhodococcus sp. 15-725-2-2b]